MSDPEFVSMAREIFATNAYMTIASADAEGVPWASPVWFAREGYEELFWVSKPGSQHSQNIEVRPAVAIVVFDSQVPMGNGRAVYMTAQAEHVTEREEIERGMEVFSRRSVEQGGRTWTSDDVTGNARLRLYRAAVTQHWVLTPSDLREPVDLR